MWLLLLRFVYTKVCASAYLKLNKANKSIFFFIQATLKRIHINHSDKIKTDVMQAHQTLKLIARYNLAFDGNHFPPLC